MALLTYVATGEGAGTSISTIVSSMQTSFQSTATEMMTAIGNIPSSFVTYRWRYCSYFPWRSFVQAFV